MYRFFSIEKAGTSSPTAAPTSTKKVATKGIPPSLLAKIREKEAKKAVENLVSCDFKIYYALILRLSVEWWI